ncbi:hypothetical protein SteCoe_24059 [Stentor coeruleus]|uniref:Uncharacterized protein n=1 Tax=Stentor coeruleus TaxID=5963 RepID=A0A1R2BIF7_9CILI|nr:hypothetical protein SteCoe_24059 [Stentor coeruleus]
MNRTQDLLLNRELYGGQLNQNYITRWNERKITEETERKASALWIQASGNILACISSLRRLKIYDFQKHFALVYFSPYDIQVFKAWFTGRTLYFIAGKENCYKIYKFSLDKNILKPEVLFDNIKNIEDTDVIQDCVVIQNDDEYEIFDLRNSTKNKIKGKGTSRYCKGFILCWDQNNFIEIIKISTQTFYKINSFTEIIENIIFLDIVQDTLLIFLETFKLITYNIMTKDIKDFYLNNPSQYFEIESSGESVMQLENNSLILFTPFPVFINTNQEIVMISDNGPNIFVLCEDRVLVISKSNYEVCIVEIKENCYAIGCNEIADEFYVANDMGMWGYEQSIVFE